MLLGNARTSHRLLYIYSASNQKPCPQIIKNVGDMSLISRGVMKRKKKEAETFVDVNFIPFRV